MFWLLKLKHFEGEELGLPHHFDISMLFKILMFKIRKLNWTISIKCKK